MNIEREMINRHNSEGVPCYTIIAVINGKREKSVCKVVTDTDAARAGCVALLEAIETPV